MFFLKWGAKPKQRKPFIQQTVTKKDEGVSILFEYQLMTDEQKDLVKMVRQMLDKELAPIVADIDKSGEYPMEIHTKMGEMGFFAMDVPAEYGGVGLDAETICHVREALGYVDAGFACSFSASTFGIKPVLLFGTEEQKHYYAEKLVAGKISANCMTEPQSGSDLGNTKTKAVRDGDYYIINGRKCFATNGGLADIYTIGASTDPAAGNRGISLFIIDRDTPGISVGKEEDKMGIRASNTTDVVFEDVRIPVKNRVGEENAGFKMMLKVLSRTRPTGMAPGLGVAQHALDLAVNYARTRVAFGGPIGKKQAIQFKLADMEIGIQTARQQLLYNAKLIDQGIYDSRLGSVTKTYVADVAMMCAHNAMQIFGGYGYSRGYPVEKLFRDARIFSLFEGTNEIQRMSIGGGLLGKLK